MQARLQEIDDVELIFSPLESRQEFAAAEELLRRAIAARATDIHLDPYGDEVGVRFRIDSRLEHYCRAANLQAVVSQRLVWRLCDECATWRAATDNEQEIFLAAGFEAPAQVRSAVCCSHCRMSGYYERIGIFEIANNSGELAEAIKNGAAESDIRRILRRAGIASHIADGLEKVCRGITTIEEVARIQRAYGSRDLRANAGADPIGCLRGEDA
jgi:type II secretory ATPase GspE/PulE/Tfp pilus assembly ATPase PilB-like protein